MKTPEAEMGDQVVLYEYIAGKLSSGGLTKKEYESIKGFPIGHNSVEGFVKLNVAVGNLDWRGEILVNADRTFNLKLTSQEEEKLKAGAEKSGLTPREFATQIVIAELG